MMYTYMLLVIYFMFKHCYVHIITHSRWSVYCILSCVISISVIQCVYAVSLFPVIGAKKRVVVFFVCFEVLKPVESLALVFLIVFRLL